MQIASCAPEAGINQKQVSSLMELNSRNVFRGTSNVEVRVK